MSEEKPKKCPKCNATLSQTDSFCGYCGANLEDTSQTQSSFQKPTVFQQSGTTAPIGQQPTQYSTQQRGYQPMTPYGSNVQVVQLSEEQMDKLILRSKVASVTRNAWLTFCPFLVFSIFFFVLTMINIYQVRKIVGKNPIYRNLFIKAFFISLAGLVLNIGVTVLTYFVFFGGVQII